MKSAVYTKAGQVGLAEIDRPQIEAQDDAIIRIVRTCVCGSDLWSYRNPEIEEGHSNSGHEAIGIVEEVGDDVTTVTPEVRSTNASTNNANNGIIWCLNLWTINFCQTNLASFGVNC